MKSSKTMTIETKYLKKVEDLVESGKAPSFSKFTENAIIKALEVEEKE